MLANFSLFREMTNLTKEDFPEAMVISGVDCSGHAPVSPVFPLGHRKSLQLLASCTPALKL